MSSGTWIFNDLRFPKPDIRAYEDLSKDVVKRIEEARDGGEVLEIFFEYNELLRKINDNLEVSFIHHSMDTTDEFYEKEQQWVDENMPLFTKLNLDFSEAIYNSPFRSEIEEKLGPMYFTKMDVKKKAFMEENIPLRKRVSELCGEYQKIIASCEVEINGDTKNFLTLQGLFRDEDREVRKTAFKAFSNFLSSNEKRMEEIWDELIKVRTQMGKNLGYDSYVPVGYLERGRIDYNPDDVARFRKQVEEEIVPLCSRIYEAQAKRLGLDEIMVYDELIAFPDGNAKPVGGEAYMLNQIIEMFRELSNETNEFVDFMLDHGLIDCEVRPGKSVREYSTFIASYKAPFLFSFFDGSAKGVKTLIEGLGNAFALYRASRRQLIDAYYISTSDITEIHAMVMTQLSNRFAERFFGEDADRYIFYNYHDLITFIPFGVAVDEFQHICYGNPDLTPEQRTREWRKLEKKYMPWRKYDEDDVFMNGGGFWYNKHHIFHYPMYYIEYALATVNSMELIKNYMERPATAWQDYLELTDIGGSKRYLDILHHASITPAYEDGAVANAISYAKELLEEYN